MSLSTLRDIDEIKSVPHKFTKRLPGLYRVSYTDRLEHLHLQSLELRRLVTDLIWCSKIVFGHVDIDIDDSLNIRPVSHTRGHDYKLYNTHTIGTRTSFFKCLEWFAYYSRF